MVDDFAHNAEKIADKAGGLFAALEFPLDVAVVDLGLPKLSGLELIRRVRADVATFAQPNQLSVGMDYVLVNGTPIRRDGVSFSGGDLRPGRMAKPSLR